LGDNADMAMIELVDLQRTYTGGKKEVKKAKADAVEKLHGDEATEARVAEADNYYKDAE
jgi:large subunit ribosomal protein L17